MCSYYISCYAISLSIFLFFFFNDTATTEIYTLSLHDALPILAPAAGAVVAGEDGGVDAAVGKVAQRRQIGEHTSELQSRRDLVCRLLLEKKKNKNTLQRYTQIIINKKPPLLIRLPLTFLYSMS